MPRFADYILTGRCRAWPSLEAALQRAVHINSDSVAVFVREQMEREVDEHGGVRVGPTVFPNAAPQFDTMWFDWSMRDGFLGWRSEQVMARATGNELVRKSVEQCRNGFEGVLMESERCDSGGWRVRIKFLSAYRNDWVKALAAARFFVSESGAIDPASFVSEAIEALPREAIPEHLWDIVSTVAPVAFTPDKSITEDGVWLSSGPALMAVSFMHCKNVRVTDQENSMFERRTWKDKHKRPLVRYKVLEIDPMRKVLQTEGGSETNGMKKALHICRGHFATYGNGHGKLFGRVEGTFWIPQHVRGTRDAGLIAKDYRVKAPA